MASKLRTASSEVEKVSKMRATRVSSRITSASAERAANFRSPSRFRVSSRQCRRAWTPALSIARTCEQSSTIRGRLDSINPLSSWTKSWVFLRVKCSGTCITTTGPLDHMLHPFPGFNGFVYPRQSLGVAARLPVTGTPLALVAHRPRGGDSCHEPMLPSHRSHHHRIGDLEHHVMVEVSEMGSMCNRVRQVESDADVGAGQNRAVLHDSSVINMGAIFHICAARNQTLVGDGDVPPDEPGRDNSGSALQLSSLCHPHARSDFTPLGPEQATQRQTVNHQAAHFPPTV